MRGTLHITENENCTKSWSIHCGYGVAITQHNLCYCTITNAIRAAKKQAKKFGVIITEGEFHTNNGKSVNMEV